MNMLYSEYGCDAVLCRPNTFNIHGHATLHSACRICPNMTDDNILGRTSCDDIQLIHGDLNGDGILSVREILRMIYIDTLGRFWGPGYHTWANMTEPECRLVGITCIHGEILKLDFSSAKLCSNGNYQPGPKELCKGIPSEIGEITSLEYIQLSNQLFLRGTIPTEVGKLTELQILDVSNSILIDGQIPSEIGNLSNLRQLLMSNCRFTGTIPSSIFHLSDLEKLDVSNNQIRGSLPTQIGKAKNLKELLISRNELTGLFPTQIGRMTKLENLDAYLNYFAGRIPAEFALPTIKRIGKLNG